MAPRAGNWRREGDSPCGQFPIAETPIEGRVTMFRNLIFAVLCLAAFSTAGFAQAPDHGSADKARAMLEKAVAAVSADKAGALDKFNNGEGGFKDGDLYVFCANASDSVETAHPTHKGVKLNEVKDVNGFAFGQEIMKNAKDGEISEVTYKWPRPGSDVPVEKITFFTKVGDQICGVGYYK
jgi:Single Cache domain 2